jgi:hypothetical protein
VTPTARPSTGGGGRNRSKMRARLQAPRTSSPKDRAASARLPS